MSARQMQVRSRLLGVRHFVPYPTASQSTCLFQGEVSSMWHDGVDT
jgi:hypothetical protein